MPEPIDATNQTPHPDDAGAFWSVGESKLIGQIRLRGADGADGVDGENFDTPPMRSGFPGRDGGNATGSSDGKPGGSIAGRISYASSDPREIHLRARLTMTSQVPAEINEVLSIGNSGYLFIDAAGGKGGNGGRGGDGQPGSDGRRGIDATRFSIGTDGQDGGSGGDAGNPTDGSLGGDGGNVTLEVGESDLGLLMLVKGDLSGGTLGFAGERGNGGIGGAGGAGGSSCHWTTTSSRTDSKGNTTIRTHHHYNPGGSDGHRGRDGRGSSYRARDGQAGTTGQLKIVVKHSDGSESIYPAPYDLELITFDVASEYSVLEPDSLISIDNVVIRNCGQMPTPGNYTIRISIQSDRWLVHDEVDLVLPKSLAPDETYVFGDRGLRLRLGDHVVDSPRKRSFRAHQLVSPYARMESGIARPFRQFENSQQVLLQFPVELTPITSLNSIAPGESTRLIWGIKNVSEETFDQKYLYRAIQSSIRLIGGDINPKHIVFFDTNDARFDIHRSRFVQPAAELGPGKTLIFETRFGVKMESTVVPYQGFAIGAELDLQRPKSSAAHNQYRCIGFRQTFIRVSERYQRTEGSRFLLVANQKTTVNDIDKWTQMADYFGSSLDVWDVSYYGFLDLVRAVDKDKSLLEHWRGMTIIVPNNYYQTPEGTTVAFHQLAKAQFIRAAADFDISFYIVGDSRTGGAELLQRSLIPVDDGTSKSQLKSQHDFLKAIARWNKYIERNRQVVGGVTGGADDFAELALGGVHEFNIAKRTFLIQPNEKWLTAEANRLAKKLQRDDPLHRWIIVHRYDSRDTDTSWGLLRRRQVGTLEARRTLDASKGSAVLFEVDGIDAIDRDFINSEANKNGVFLALKFEDKVDRFIRLVSERVFPRFRERYVDRPLTDQEVEQIGGSLVSAILTDIFNEQKVARVAKTWGPMGVKSLTPKLNYLAERSLNYGVHLDQMENNPGNMHLLYKLIAGIEYIALESTTVWDSWLIPTSIFKRSRAVSAHMRNRCDRIKTSIFGRNLTWWDKVSGPDDDYNPFGGARKKNRKGIERQLANKEIENELQNLRFHRTKLDQFTVAQQYPGLTYDPELLEKSVRVMSGQQFDAYVNAEATATRERYETEVSVKSKRADLLVPMRKVDTIDKQTETSALNISTTQTTSS